MIKQQEIDTTSLLWEYYFKVRMPYLQTRSLQDIKNTGVAVTGIREIDNDIPNQQLTTMLTIAQMAEYYQEGVPIRVVMYEDIKTIYSYISQHIHAWKSRLQYGVNIGNAPIQDLILLDQFANAIYDHAKYQFTTEIADSLIGQHFAKTQRATVNNFFNSRVIGQLNKPANFSYKDKYEEKEEEYPERDSLGEFFKHRLMNLRR